MDPLQAINPLDGRYSEKTQELAKYVSEEGLIRERVSAECTYFIMLSEYGVIRDLTTEENAVLVSINSAMSFEDILRVKEIEKTTNHDVKSVEVWLREYFSKTSLADITGFFHYCLTSEDINNVAYRLQLQKSKDDIIVPAVNKIIDFIMDFARKYRGMPMLGRTHGQPAIPTTVGKEMVNFAVRLKKESKIFENFKLTAKMNGAVGCYNAHYLIEPDIGWISFSQEYATRLGLKSNLFTTQINAPEDIIECLQILQRINGILIDLCQDMWRYISDDWFKQQKKDGEVGSSTMAQKVNPIDFENGEANLQQSNAIIAGFVSKLPISRLQRDLSDSSTLRNIGPILGYNLVACKSILRGLGKISPNEPVITSALNNNWAILSEPVQLVLKKYSEVDDPYSLVKAFFRGQQINQTDYQNYIDSLPLAARIKESLKNLTPQEYFGLAPDLVISADKQLF